MLQEKTGIVLQWGISMYFGIQKLSLNSCLNPSIFLWFLNSPINHFWIIFIWVDSYGGWTGHQSWKKGCSTAAMLPEGNRQDHFWQKDFGQLNNICHIFWLIMANCYQFCHIFDSLWLKMIPKVSEENNNNSNYNHNNNNNFLGLWLN